MSNDERIIKALETIAKCILKQTQFAEEAIKKSRELYEANVAMMKESQIEPVPLSEKQLKDLNEYDDEDEPF